MTEKQFSKGTVIFREGENGTNFYRINDGSVGVYAGYGTASQEQIAVLKTGDYFGEMAAIDAYPRNATVVAETDVKADEITSEETVSFFTSSADRFTELMEQLSDRIKATTEDYKKVIAAIETVQVKPAEKESVMDTLKKFAAVYANRKKESEVSVEAIRNKVASSDHNTGKSAKTETYSKGTLIFREGDIGKNVYDVHTGKVGIVTGYGTLDEKTISEIYPNHFFGELGMIGGYPRNASAVALEDDTMVELISKDDLPSIHDENPAKLEMLLTHFTYRLRKTTLDYLEACKVAGEIAASGADSAVSFKKDNDIASL